MSHITENVRALLAELPPGVEIVVSGRTRKQLTQRRFLETVTLKICKKV